VVLSFTGGRGGQILERGEFMSDELGGFGKCQSPSLTRRKTPRGRQDLQEQTSSKQAFRSWQDTQPFSWRCQEKNSSLELVNYC
jgi:hypothetical protein